jgi:predicted nicotinamide N-methyase
MADLLYEPELARRAARHALAALERGARVLVGDPGRYSRREFQTVLRNAGIRPVFEHVVARAPGEHRPARIGIALLEPRP